MSAERFERLERLFGEGLAVPRPERDAWLDRVTAGDAALRAELLEMLESAGDDEETDDDLIVGVRKAATDLMAGAASDPESIGAYRILGRLGEGGMGVVYLAEQTAPVRRRVALKVIKIGMDTRDVVARFDAERQALAMMDHPNIARVFDAGATPEGRPYFVMEVVQGEAITRFCDERRLTLRQRLELFIPVCYAVQHAHQKGVIHRDLKPSNMPVELVDGRPVPKVIDFGVAKATGVADLLSDRHYTRTGQIIGTPAYMSPEQASRHGVDIDTRTDIYSLGLVLYELLVGELPFDPPTGDARRSELERLIREQEPPRLTTRLAWSREDARAVAQRRGVEPDRLRRDMRGDLEWITRKALEKNRDRRYQSAGELAADIQRHLDNEPIVARPPSTGDRMRKFVRRNRAGVLGAAAVSLALLMGGVAASVESVRAFRAEREAEAQRDAARVEAGKARATSEFLQETFSSIDPATARGREVTVREILDNAARRIDDELADQPEIAAALRTTIGSTYRALGRYDEAARHFRVAAETYRTQRGADSPEAARVGGLLGIVMLDQGRYDDADRLLAAALETQMRTLGPTDQETLATRNNQARLRRLQGRIDEAERIFREMVAIREDATPRDEIEIVRARVNLAEALMWAGRADDATEAVAPALEACGTVVSEDHPVTPLAREIGAWAALGRGDLDESERLRRSAIDGYTRILGATHPATLSAEVRLAWLLADTDRPDEALALAEFALAELRTIFGDTHDSTLEAMTAVAYAAGRAGDRVRAAAIDRQVYEARVRRFGPEHPTTLAALNNLGGAQWWAGQYEEALATYRDLLEIRRRVSGADHPETLTAINNIAFALQRLGDLAAARDQFDLAAAERSRVLGPTHQSAVQSAMAAADTRFQMGDHADAAERYLEIANRMRTDLIRTAPQYVLAVASAAGSFRAAEDAHRALEVLDEFSAPLDLEALRPVDRVRLDRARAEALQALGSFGEAEALLRDAYARAADALGADAPETRRTARALVTLLEESGRSDEANEWRARTGDQPTEPVAGG
jgi:non-specific serine/threonine protein kinase/serine/threonine-protein kinase